MKRLFIRILIVIIPFLLIVPIINYCVDPADIYHGEESVNIIINGIRNGKNVVCRKNINDRIFKRKLLEINKNKHYNYMIFGSSRVKTISNEALGDCLLNLGVSACRFYDFLSFYEICKENNVKYDTIIIGLDYFTLGDIDRPQWKDNAKYYNRFIGKNDSYRPYISKEKITNMLSFSYFQESLHTLKSRSIENIYYTDSLINEATTYRVDGSKVYDSYSREFTKTDSIAKIYSILDIYDIPQEHINLMETLIEKLKDEHIKVYFFFAPYHPIYYARLRNEKITTENERLLQIIAERYEVETIGSFDPKKGNYVSSDFYDATHPKAETVDRIFKEYFANKEKDSACTTDVIPIF
ncbi:MAG: hypothetical protein IKJ56_06725 [Bacteroidales bacterium]|nr:hypothetical protein [Bacteroidales bacterium]